jgi:hypothetical protein
VYKDRVDEAQVIAEDKALSAALAVIDERGDYQIALAAVQRYRDIYAPTNDVEGVIIDTALRVICEGRPAAYPHLGPAQTITEWVAFAWIAWACGKADERLEAEIEGFLMAPPVEGPKPRGGYLHRMALQQCLSAVQALLTNDYVEAQRRFRRAIKFGTEYGTSSNPVIQWTYAASFFPQK